VLFAVASFAGLRQAVAARPDEMLAGARVEVAPYKRDPGDFVLWKPSTTTCPAGTALGPRPAGLAHRVLGDERAHLGETIDIHAGGVDLQFPHHENEIAQSDLRHGGKTFRPLLAAQRHAQLSAAQDVEVAGQRREGARPAARTRRKRCATRCCRRTTGSRWTGRTR
jgi:cysteinyl-tRNA synthetase